MLYLRINSSTGTNLISVFFLRICNTWLPSLIGKKIVGKKRFVPSDIKTFAWENKAFFLAKIKLVKLHVSKKYTTMKTITKFEELLL